MLQLISLLLSLLDLGLEGFSKLDACKEESSSVLCCAISACLISAAILYLV